MSFIVPFINGSSLNPNLEFDNLLSKPHKTYETMINNTGPVPWTLSNWFTLRTILDLVKDDFLVPQVRVTWPFLDERFASNLDKLLISLKAYYDSKNPVIPKETLFYFICEEKGAEILKRVRTKAIMNTWHSSFIEEPEWWNDIPTYSVCDIGDIFYYKYTFFWEEEVEDYKEQLTPLVYDKKWAGKFRTELLSIFEELDFDFDFEPDEILFQPRSSKVIDKNFESKNDFEIRYEKFPEFRYGPRHPGKRCVIPVHPGGVRDTIINQMPDLNTVMAIDKIVARALKGHSSTIDNNSEIFMKRLDEFHTKYNFFYCRDITKEGITKPRYLLKIMMEELYKKSRAIRMVCTPDFFDGDWCQIDDEVIHSQRGHGLGMGNSLTTLMQLVIFNLTVIKYAKTNKFEEDDVAFFTLNDDCVFGLKLSEEEAFEFSQLDHEILDNLGLIRKKTKSFMCEKGFVFLEIYFPEHLNVKESIMRRSMLLPYSAVNIVHAKDLMSLLTDNPYLSLILSKWGYEFYPEEVHFPRCLGGWFSKNFYGVDISLDIHLEEFTSQMSRAGQAVLSCDINLRKKLISNKDPLDLMNYCKDLDEYLYNKMPLVGSAMFSHFDRLKIRRDFNILYQKVARKRQLAYQKAKHIDFETFLDILIENSDRDIFISNRYSKWVTNFDIDIYKRGFSDPYSYSYPLCSAIRKLKDIEIKNLPSSFWPLAHGDASFNCSILRSEIAEMNLDYYAFEYSNEDVVLPKDEIEFKQFVNSWKNPIAVGKYCQLRFNKLMIPSMVPSVMKYKKGFFPRELSRIEYLMLQGKSYSFISSYLASEIDLEIYLEETIIKDEPRIEVDPYYLNQSDDEPFVDQEEIESTLKRMLKLYGQETGDLVENIFPEGWSKEDFEVESNIFYAMENPELFSEDAKGYLNRRYDNCMKAVGHWNTLVLLMISYHESEEERDVRRQKVFEMSRYVKPYVDYLKQREAEKSEEETPFTDFDLF